jgi:hypothetical protein
MRLDGRKSMMLSDTKRITPSANLMEPRWRQTFQDALKKLEKTGEEFKNVDFRLTPAAAEAVAREAQLDAVRTGSSAKPDTTSTTFKSAPDARTFVRRLGTSGARAGADTPGASDVRITPDMDKAVTWGSTVGHAGNLLAAWMAKLPGRIPKAIGFTANILAPPAAMVAGPMASNNVADIDLKAQAPELQAGAAIAKAEADRLRGGGGRDPALGELYAKRPDILTPYQEAQPGLSQADSNALLNSEMGVSMALARNAGPFGPIVASGLGAGLTIAGASKARAAAEAANQKIEAENVKRVARGEKENPLLPVPELASANDIAQYALTPAAAWGAARAGSSFLRATPLAFGAASAISAIAQMSRAQLDPRMYDEIRRRESFAPTSGAARAGKVLYRTAMGDPIGAATAFDLGGEAELASRNEAMQARRFVIDTKHGRLPVDLDKIHMQTGAAMQAAPGIPNTAMAQLLQPALRSEDGLRYMAKRPLSRLTAEDAAVHARDIVNELSRTWNVPLTNTALYEVTRLVQTIGPGATIAALVPAPDHSDKQDELRAYAVLENKTWVPPAVYAQRAALYDKAFPKNAPQTAPSTGKPPPTAATPNGWQSYAMPLGVGAATLGTLALLNRKKKKEQEEQA